MNTDNDLTGDDWEERLQWALAALPEERAPRQLRRALKRIPREQRSAQGWRWFSPAWAFALLLVPLALMVYVQNDRLQQQEQQLAQGRQDLATALSYIEKANLSASRQVRAAIDTGLTRPVTDNTLEALQQPLEITREYEL